MSDVPVWTCEFSANEPASSVDGKLDHLTVADHFRLQCHGDLAVDWTAELPVVKFAKPEQEYTLVILSAEDLKPQSAQFTVTGYIPGAHAPEYIRVMQKDRGFETEKPKWKIDSILSAEQQAPKPFPSFGPFHVAMPVWLSFVYILAIVVGLLLLGRFVYRWFKRRSFKRELAGHRTALRPVRQFYRDARALRRRLNAATTSADVRTISADLDREFRMLLMREFEVPALATSDAAILKELTRRHRPVMDVCGELLRKTLRELSRAQTREATLEADVDQLLRMCVDAAELIERGA